MENPPPPAQISVLEQVQHYLLTQALDGLLPYLVDPYRLKQVLDVQCRTGAWAVDLALSYPGVAVTGLDKDAWAVEMARGRAVTANVDRAHFYEADLSKPLPLADETFDLVHLLVYQPVFRPDQWSWLLQECKRVMKPGAVINLVNFTFGPNSSEVCQSLLIIAGRLMDALGYDFSDKPGTSSPGVYFPGLLRQAGFANSSYLIRPVNLAGWNNPQGRAACQLFLSDLAKYKDFFIQFNLVRNEEFDELVAQARQAIATPGFCATAALISAFATKE